jgi:hypothetical protein
MQLMSVAKVLLGPGALALATLGCANSSSSPATNSAHESSAVGHPVPNPTGAGGDLTGTSNNGGACASDDVCAQGHFCDLGRCAAVHREHGQHCEAAPRTEHGIRDGKLSTCGAYICRAGRCRSCESDAECQAELGSPGCYDHESRPGWRCGNPP